MLSLDTLQLLSHLLWTDACVFDQVNHFLVNEPLLDVLRQKRIQWVSHVVRNSHIYQCCQLFVGSLKV